MASCLIGPSFRAEATTYDPILTNPQMIVVAFSVVSDEQRLASLVPQMQLQQNVARYLSSRFAETGIDILVTDLNHFKDPPAGVFPQNVIMLFVRADLASISFDLTGQRLVGSVSTWVRRGTDSLLTSEPATFFGAENEDDMVPERVNRAAIDQVEKNIVAPIVFLAK